MTRRTCPDTLDLLAWEPPRVGVPAYDEGRVRSASLRARVARAVSETLRDAPMDRESVALAMSAWLGEDVTKNMLDAYASEAREAHTIPYLRLIALVHVTGDARLLGLGAEAVGQLVVERKYLPWIEVGMRADRKERVRRVAEEEDREFELALRAARRGG